MHLGPVDYESHSDLAWRVQIGRHNSANNMKTSLKLIALLIAAGYPVAAFAQFAGAQVPSIINAQNIASVFTAVFVGLMLLKDYSRRTPSLAVSAPVIVPPAHTFVARTDRLAA